MRAVLDHSAIFHDRGCHEDKESSRGEEAAQGAKNGWERKTRRLPETDTLVAPGDKVRSRKSSRTRIESEKNYPQTHLVARKLPVDRLI